jgi:hypothetical protein
VVLVHAQVSGACAILRGVQVVRVSRLGQLSGPRARAGGSQTGLGDSGLAARARGGTFISVTLYFSIHLLSSCVLLSHRLRLGGCDTVEKIQSRQDSGDQNSVVEELVGLKQVGFQVGSRVGSGRSSLAAPARTGSSQVGTWCGRDSDNCQVERAQVSVARRGFR